MLIVRRDPERVLDVLLPPFDVAARFVQPLTGALVGLIVDARRDRLAAAAVVERRRRRRERGAGGRRDAGEEKRLIEEEERQLLQSIVDFGDTLVREVMTPRPDIVAIRGRRDARRPARAVPRAAVLAHSRSTSDNLDNIVGFVFVKDLFALPPRRRAAADRSR